MFLLYSVSALRKIGDHREQQRQGPQILKHLQKCPPTQQVGKPISNPLNGKKRSAAHISLAPDDLPMAPAAFYI